MANPLAVRVYVSSVPTRVIREMSGYIQRRRDLLRILRARTIWLRGPSER